MNGSKWDGRTSWWRRWLCAWDGHSYNWESILRCGGANRQRAPDLDDVDSNGITERERVLLDARNASSILVAALSLLDNAECMYGSMNVVGKRREVSRG